jgi:hypothetical protein
MLKNPANFFLPVNSNHFINIRPLKVFAKKSRPWKGAAAITNSTKFKQSIRPWLNLPELVND